MSFIKTNCKNCNKEFSVRVSRFKHGRGKYCSRHCQYNSTNKDKKGVHQLCIGCGKKFYTFKSKIKQGRGNGKYCSRLCRDKYRIKELHPDYLGFNRPYYRGPNWQKQRRKAKKRDNYTCKKCGLLGIDVHHIKPYRCFSSYIEANKLNNLITLCKKCHMIEEMSYRRTKSETKTFYYKPGAYAKRNPRIGKDNQNHH